MARYVSLLIIAALILCLGATFYQVLAPFLMPLFLAAMAALLAQPILRHFLERWPDRRPLAAALTTVTVLAPMMLPVLIGILVSGYQLSNLASRLGEEFGETIPAVQKAIPDSAEEARALLAHEKDLVTEWTFNRINSVLGEKVTSLDIEMLELDDDQIARLNENEEVLLAARENVISVEFMRIRGRLLELAGSVALRTLRVVGSSVGSAFEATVDRTLALMQACIATLLALVVFTMALFYFLADGPELIAGAQALIPVDRDHQNELLKKFESSVRAVVLATFLAAIGQGIATALCLKFAGFGYFFVLLALSTFAALVPMAGTPLVWIPAVVWLGIEGHWGAAIFVALFCLIVVGFLDNVIRTWVLKSDTSLHPLLAFVSVLGGLQVMGLWGVFIGPIVACCLHSLIEIFNSELKAAAKFGDAPQPELAVASSQANAVVQSGQSSEDRSVGQSSAAAPESSSASGVSQPETEPVENSAATKTDSQQSAGHQGTEKPESAE